MYFCCFFIALCCNFLGPFSVTGNLHNNCLVRLLNLTIFNLILELLGRIMYNYYIKVKGDNIMILENCSRFMHNSINTSLNDYINLLHVGWEICSSGYTYVNRRNIYLLHYVHSGKGYLQINDSKYELSANDAFLIRPNQLATYTADDDDPWEYCYFAFSGELAEKLLSKTCFADNNICARLKSDKLYEYIKESVYDLNDSNSLEFLSIEYFFKFLSCIYSSLSHKNQCISQHKNQYVSTLEEYIMFNYQKNISVSELSKIFNLNRSHLHRIFKKQTGRSVEEFIIYVRMQEAKRFLRETNYSINDISHLVGYNNYPSFFRTFKAAEGITPTEYRDKHSEIARTN